MLSKEDLIAEANTLSVPAFFRQYIEDREPTYEEWDIVAKLMSQYQMGSEKINMMFYYAMVVFQSSLSMPLAEMFAQEWEKERLKTVKRLFRWLEKHKPTYKALLYTETDRYKQDTKNLDIESFYKKYVVQEKQNEDDLLFISKLPSCYTLHSETVNALVYYVYCIMEENLIPNFSHVFAQELESLEVQSAEKAMETFLQHHNRYVFWIHLQKSHFNTEKERIQRAIQNHLGEDVFYLYIKEQKEKSPAKYIPSYIHVLHEVSTKGIEVYQFNSEVWFIFMDFVDRYLGSLVYDVRGVSERYMLLLKAQKVSNAEETLKVLKEHKTSLLQPEDLHLVGEDQEHFHSICANIALKKWEKEKDILFLLLEFSIWTFGELIDSKILDITRELLGKEYGNLQQIQTYLEIKQLNYYYELSQESLKHNTRLN
ncbi:DnaD domain protein [Priestia filamentosa]|uniref:DnaD domain protein n=1 Tax=Priestia filamentosa TaxID=1402861 RepID=UPI00058945F7